MPGAATTNALELYVTNPSTIASVSINLQTAQDAGNHNVGPTTLADKSSTRIGATQLLLTSLETSPLIIQRKGIYVASTGPITVQVYNTAY